ncbi:MAG: hypothetical protein EU529_15240 [Promethearchaeota archaeon]|nr:MAG: hypothetical protein EU529_15240 [Candidatus Lokiarchaeota archaeon]
MSPVEVDLEEFEEFYNERINEQFYKIKRATKKLIYDIRNSLIDIKICMDHFLDSQDKIDQKSLRSLNLFSERIKSYVDEIEIPEEEEINYSNLIELINSIKKLFKSINVIARKSLPKFQKEVQTEIKELNYRTRKLQKKQAMLDSFLRKKYGDVKNAEDLLKKLPKLISLKENIENSKSDLASFELMAEETNKSLEKLNSEIINLEKNELFKKLEREREKLFKLKIKINDEIGFKKALKKLKFELDKETIHISNINLNYLRNFLKDPVAMLIKESKDLPKFSALLVHLRHTLEEGNILNLKTDTKVKTIEQINKIFDKKIIHEFIEEFKNLRKNIKEIEQEIKDAGLSEKLKDFKNKISINTAKLEHIQLDVDRKNKDYTKYLESLKEEREILQKAISDILQEDLKINITFEF